MDAVNSRSMRENDAKTKRPQSGVKNITRRKQKKFSPNPPYWHLDS
jgi:hypothetical protein